MIDSQNFKRNSWSIDLKFSHAPYKNISQVMIEKIKFLKNISTFKPVCSVNFCAKKSYFADILPKIKIFTSSSIINCINLVFGLEKIFSRKIFFTARHLLSKVLLEWNKTPLQKQFKKSNQKKCFWLLSGYNPLIYKYIRGYVYL